jgi:hypothetical protein
MVESREPVLLLEGRRNDGFAERVAAAAEEEPLSEGWIRAGLEAVAAWAEADPGAAGAALRELRGDHAALARLEACLGGSPEHATLALGAAIQTAIAVLASPAPDLRSRLPELARWLAGG